MGQLKQLLPLGGRPAIRWIVEVVCSRLEHVVVVLGHRAGDIASTLADCGAQCVVNPEYRSGMLSSVQCGVRQSSAAADYLICLGDQPALEGSVIDQVLNAGLDSGKGIAIPTWQGKRGHPILIGNAYRAEILSLPLELGLNRVTRGHPEDVCEVTVQLATVLEDMDTPDDYQRELNRWEKQ
jgi:molybdenum cofactor cytidylyltransferase